MGGLARRMPQTMIVFLVGTLSLAGIPFFGGFFSKEEILGAVLAGGLTVPFAMLVLAAFLTAFYMFRVVFLAFFGQPAARGLGGAMARTRRPRRPASPRRAPGDDAAALAPRAAVGGHRPPLRAPSPHRGVRDARAGSAARRRGGRRRHPPRVADVSAAGHRCRRGSPPRSARFAGPRCPGSGSTTLFAGLYRGVLLGFSRIIGWLDRYLVDGIVNVLSAWTLDAGDRLRRIQSGQPQDYVYGVAIGLLLLLVWIQWPR